MLSKCFVNTDPVISTIKFLVYLSGGSPGDKFRAVAWTCGLHRHLWMFVKLLWSVERIGWTALQRLHSLDPEQQQQQQRFKTKSESDGQCERTKKEKKKTSEVFLGTGHFRWTMCLIQTQRLSVGGNSFIYSTCFCSYKIFILLIVYYVYHFIVAYAFLNSSSLYCIWPPTVKQKQPYIARHKPWGERQLYAILYEQQTVCPNGCLVEALLESFVFCKYFSKHT